MKQRTIKRSELYRMVWVEPLTKLAPGLGLSDVGLRKVCVRNNIPVPPRGHWAKAAQGRIPNPAPLPKASQDWDLRFTLPPEPPEDAAEQFHEVFGKPIELERLPENRIVVAPVSDTPHAMTKALRKKLLGARADQYGGLLCEDPATFRVRVPEASIERALAIVDCLAKAFEARGLTIQKGDGERYTTTAGVLVGESLIRISLEETSTRQTHLATPAEKEQIRRRGYSSAPLYDFKPSGVMTLSLQGVWRAGFQSSWRDSASRRLEDRLNEVMVGIYRAAQADSVRRREDAARKLRVDTENERRAALRAEREAEIAFLKSFQDEAAAWAKAQALRDYIAALEAAHTGQAPMPAKVVAWLENARRHADRIDPLRPNPPSALDYQDSDLRPLYAWELKD